MKRKTFRCLFCFGDCSTSNLQVNGPLWKEEIPGAVYCSTLKRQLQNLFILRNILDIEASWCADNLRRRTEAEDSLSFMDDDEEDPSIEMEDDGSLEFWFRLCPGCMGKVEEVWRLYQKLLNIQEKMDAIKNEIKSVMKEGMKKNGNSSKHNSGGGITDDIRKIVFPRIEAENDSVNSLEDEDVAIQGGNSDDDVEFKFIPEPVELEQEEVVAMEISEPELESQQRPQFKRRHCRPSSSTKSRRKAGSLISDRYIRRKRSRKLLDKDFTWWWCTQCGSRIREYNQDKIRIHVERHKRSEEMGGGEFDCPICTYPAQDCIELEDHHQLRHTSPSKRKKIIRYKHHCPQEGCNFKTRRQETLRRHMKESHPEPEKEKATFLCSQCTRTFSQVNSLTVHLKAVHPEHVGLQLDELQCDQCDLKFITQTSLQNHIKNIHSKMQLPFICDDCGQSFRCRSYLNQHKVTHVNKLKRDHVCHVCGADYAHQRILVKHLKDFHGDNEVKNRKILKCRFCEFETPYRPALQKHIETHKEKLGFKCDQCSRCYTSGQALKRHMQLNHSGVEVPCPYCNRKFPNVEYMKDHLKKYCKVKELKEQQ